jgi:hypothetical protein
MKLIFGREIQGIILATILINIIGCVTTRGTDELWSYGEFCGSEWPKVVGLTQADRLAKLISIQASDDIDELCKEHDICYEKLGAHASSCDKDLRRNLLAIEFPREKTSCLKVKDQILYAFSCFQQTGHQQSNILTALITMPLSLAICALATSVAALGALVKNPEPGTCIATNDFRKHRMLTEQCVERAGKDLKQLTICTRKY